MTINLISENKSIHHTQIEWDQLTQIITQFAYFNANKDALVSKTYENDLELLLLEFSRTELYQHHFKDEHLQILDQIFSKLPFDDTLKRVLNHISKNGVLNFTEINKIILLIENAQFLKANFPKFNLPEFEYIRSIDFQIFQRKFLKEFRYLVDPNGDINLDRHPELADYSKRLNDLEDRIRKSVQEWLNDSNNQKVLQYSSYDLVFDRFVVPVRSDSYRSDLGLIISRSETGQTLFVEPFIIRELCNRRLELVAKIDEIINQLAIKFSHALFDQHELINGLYEQVLKIDFYVSKIKFCSRYHLEKPLISERPGFRFTQLFHPLIKNPVKNNADCGPKNYGIVISGPNTGGKTVFLKSIALSYLLFYHGFFVPAQSAEMYPYKGIFYFGNDLQNLQVGLSSFSGEVKNYIQLIEQILESNLILIDEIFNSTSSDEASALSLAYFNELHKRANCHIVVSTHHQMFKTLIHQDRSYISCHVGFDTVSMKPTYKVQWGTPGASMAIDIFDILSQAHPLVKDVPTEALKHLSSKNISYETLLQRVSQKQIELDKLINTNRQSEIELKNQKGAMEGILKIKLQEELHKAKKEVEKILEEARHILEESKRNEIQRVKTIDDKSHLLKRKIQKISGYDEPTEDNVGEGDIDINLLKVGDTVFSLTLKKDFSVISIDTKKEMIQIGKGAIKFLVPLKTLASSKKSPLRAKVSVSVQKNTNARFEYDVRGLRLSECQNLIESSLGDLLTGDVPFINVIHGHGDGVLKNWLRDYVKKSKDFIVDQSESGNDGETRIVLK